MDARPRRKIEEEVKINVYGGALFLPCEASNCGVMKFGDVLQRCGNCKKVRIRCLHAKVQYLHLSPFL